MSAAAGGIVASKSAPVLKLQSPPVVTVVPVTAAEGIAVAAKSTESTMLWEFVALPERGDIYYRHKLPDGEWSDLARMAYKAWARFGLCPQDYRELKSFARWYLGGRPDSFPRGKHE